MNTIVSPTTTERIVRTVLLMGMIGVFSGLFLYDGFAGYPKKNLHKAVEALDPVPDELPVIDPGITRAVAESVSKQVQEQRVTRRDIVEELGQPAWENELGDDLRYFGPGGALVLALTGDLVQRVSFLPGEKREADLLVQKVIGFGLLPAAVFLVFQLLRVITTKVVLSDDGLKVRGRPLISFDAFTGLNAEKYRKKGYLDLAYEDQSREKTVRLDDYVIREFHAIVSEICGRCGFDNPLSSPEQKDETAVQQDA